MSHHNLLLLLISDHFSARGSGVRCQVPMHVFKFECGCPIWILAFCAILWLCRTLVIWNCRLSSHTFPKEIVPRVKLCLAVIPGTVIILPYQISNHLNLKSNVDINIVGNIMWNLATNFWTTRWNWVNWTITLDHFFSIEKHVEIYIFVIFGCLELSMQNYNISWHSKFHLHGLVHCQSKILNRLLTTSDADKGMSF